MTKEKTTKTMAQVKLRQYVDKRKGKNGFTQEKLCESFGFSASYLGQLLKGKKTNPTREIMVSIAKETGNFVKLNDWAVDAGTSDN